MRLLKEGRLGKMREIETAVAASIAACPKCGGTQGYYEIWRPTSYTQYITWDGESIGASEPTSATGGKTKRCSDCNYNVTRFIGAQL